MNTKNLQYYKDNCEDDYLKTPISVLRYISELEKEVENFQPKIVEIREAFANYFTTEGCSCCRDSVNHDIAEKKLGELLNADKYEDESGFDWYKYRTNK